VTRTPTYSTGTSRTTAGSVAANHKGCQSHRGMALTDRRFQQAHGRGRALCRPGDEVQPPGSQNAPRVAPFSLRSGPVASYDVSTGQLTWNDDPVPQKPAPHDSSSSAELARLLLQPLS
jgi:hypothetical protein